MQDSTDTPSSVRIERRRGVRFPVVVPLEAKWQNAAGKSVKATAQAVEVNALGGLLDMKTLPSVGSEIELTNLLTQESFRARVLSVRRSAEGNPVGVAVELLVPSEAFWGLNFQLKKTSAELVKLEHAMRAGEVEPRILVEFRDAVDYVRKTAWAVQEWHERQLKHRDTHTVLPLLTAERLRRATQLCDAIAADLATQEVTRETIRVEEFFLAVRRVYQHLAGMFSGSKEQ